MSSQNTPLYMQIMNQPRDQEIPFRQWLAVYKNEYADLHWEDKASVLFNLCISGEMEIAEPDQLIEFGRKGMDILSENNVSFEEYRMYIEIFYRSLGLGTFYFRDYELAFDFFRKAAKSAPSEGYYDLLTLGHMLVKRNEFDLLVTCIEQILEVFPDEQVRNQDFFNKVHELMQVGMKCSKDNLFSSSEIDYRFGQAYSKFIDPFV